MYKTTNLYKMQTLALSEFRANVSAMIDLVEKGETVRILRHGKPVAELVPPHAMESISPKIPHWKLPLEPLILPPGASLSAAILEDREDAPW
jgi:prevent-host-death family protein